MLLYDTFTTAEIQAYSEVMIYYLETTTFTRANETWAERVRLHAGILLEDSKWLTFVQSKLPDLLQYTTAGDGYYPNGTFIQHCPLPMWFCYEKKY